MVLGCDQGKEGDKDWGGDAGAATAAGGGGSKQHGTRDEQSTGGVPGEPRGQGVGMLRNKGRWWRTGFVGVWIGCPRALLLLVLLEQVCETDPNPNPHVLYLRPQTPDPMSYIKIPNPW